MDGANRENGYAVVVDESEDDMTLADPLVDPIRNKVMQSLVGVMDSVFELAFR